MFEAVLMGSGTQKGRCTVMYPFLTLDDETEITHSEYLPSGKVKVYVEKPDERDCFHHMVCYLPDYTVEDVYGFDNNEVERYMEIIRSENLRRTVRKFG